MSKKTVSDVDGADGRSCCWRHVLAPRSGSCRRRTGGGRRGDGRRSCGRAAGRGEKRLPADKGEIVFVPKSTSATFYLFLVKGAQDKAKELGYTIDYQGPATEADIAAQVDLVRNLTKKKPAGISVGSLGLAGVDSAGRGSDGGGRAGGDGGLGHRR